MKKFINGRVPFLLICIAFVALNLCFWPIVCSNGIENAKTSVWIGYGFLAGAFAICAVCTFIKMHNKNVQVALVPLFKVSSTYLFFSIIFNIIVMCINTDNYVWAVILDSLIVLIYLAAFLISYKHFNRVNENTEVREKRMKDWRLVASSVSSILSFTEDKDIKLALNKFYEHVKASSTASSEVTRSVEEELSDQIVTIKSLIKSDADKETILKAIKFAEALLKERNQKLMIR